MNVDEVRPSACVSTMNQIALNNKSSSTRNLHTVITHYLTAIMDIQGFCLSDLRFGQCFGNAVSENTFPMCLRAAIKSIFIKVLKQLHISSLATYA
jgi:hypothetical protein